jgi:hypothetical protein
MPRHTHVVPRIVERHHQFTQKFRKTLAGWTAEHAIYRASPDPGRWMGRRGGQRVQRMEKWTHDRFVEMGLYRLRGTVKYPTQATSARSSLSRVRENRTHGLKEVV